MVNENISKLINAIMENEALQKQLEEAVSQPVSRGPAAAEDKGPGSAILQALAQSAGLNFGSNDASELTQLLSAASQQSGGQGGFFGSPAGGNSSGGGLQLLNNSEPAQTVTQTTQQAAQPFTQQAAQQSAQPFFQMGQPSSGQGGTTVYGGDQQGTVQAVPIDMDTLNEFMQLFGGSQAFQQQAQPVYQAPQESGQGLGGLFNILGGQGSAQPVYQTQQAVPSQQAQPAGQFFSLGGSPSAGSSSPLGFGSSSGSSNMSSMILQMLMQLLLKQ